MLKCVVFMFLLAGAVLVAAPLPQTVTLTRNTPISTAEMQAAKRRIELPAGTAVTVVGFDARTGMIAARYHTLNFQVARDKTDWDRQILAAQSASLATPEKPIAPKAPTKSPEQIRVETLAQIQLELDGWRQEIPWNPPEDQPTLLALVKQGVAFQKTYESEKDPFNQDDLLVNYQTSRDELLSQKQLVFFQKPFMNARIMPIPFDFAVDELDIRKGRPFILNQNPALSGYNQARFFSHREAERLMTTLFQLALPAAKGTVVPAEAITVNGLRLLPKQAKQDYLAYVEIPSDRDGTPATTYFMTRLNALVLAERIQQALLDRPQSDDDPKPEDDELAQSSQPVQPENDPTTKVAKPVVTSKDFDLRSGNLFMTAVRLKASTGQSLGYDAKTQQHLTYKATLRWLAEQPADAVLTIYYIASGKAAILGKKTERITLESGRMQEVIFTGDQSFYQSVGGVIIQCRVENKLLKSYASLQQLKRYADMDDIEKQMEVRYSRIDRF